jgi:6-phosphogluconolactonase (cycloisomerase 2 family)
VIGVTRALTVLSLLAVAACGGGSDDVGGGGARYSLQGRVQKGPFAIGSEITVNVLDSALNPSGTVYATQTSDALGDFSLSSQISTPDVEIVAQGFYIDELTGQLSASQITLRAVSDLSMNSSPTVNILTTLQEQRLKTLVAQGRTFAAAGIQSATEVLALFGINAQSVNSLSTLDSMRIDGSTDEDAVLLAVSVILSQMATNSAQANGTTEAAELSELVNTIAAAIASTGTLTSTTFIPQRNRANTQIDAAAVTANLQSYYAKNGVSVTAPLFIEWVDQTNSGVLPQRLVPVTGLALSAVTAASPGQSITSNAVTVAGAGTGVVVKVAWSGATLIKNGIAVAGNLAIARDGDTLALQVTAPGYGQAVTSTLSVGSTSAQWSVTSKALGGAVSGLTGAGLVLQDNLGNVITVPSGSTTFSFPAAIPNGQSYSISVVTAPTSPLQSCAVVNGMGTAGAAQGNISVACSMASEIALVANKAAHNISVYAVDPASGALSAVPGSPFAISANSVAVDATGKYALVTASGISVYRINTATGSLMPVAGSPYADTHGPTGIAVDGAGNFAYVSNGDGTISAYSVDATSGALTEVSGSPFSTGLTFLMPLYSNLAIDQSSGYLYWTYNYTGVFLSVQTGVVGFTINPTSGSLTTFSNNLPFAPSGEPDYATPIVITSNGYFAYQGISVGSASGSGNAVAAYSIDAATGVPSAVAGSPFSATGADSVAVDPTERFLYVSDDTDIALRAYSINATTGALTPISGGPYATGAKANCSGCGFLPTYVSVDPSGQYVYVQSEFTATSSIISAFSINAANGSLTAVPGSPFAAGSNPSGAVGIAFAHILL